MGAEMRFTKQKNVEGVVERNFEIEVDGETVPGAIWAPEHAKGPRPLVLMGHGGSQHKKTPGIRARGNAYAKALGYAVAAIDAPGHGDRISRDEALRYSREVGKRIRKSRYLARCCRVERAVDSGSGPSH